MSSSTTSSSTTSASTIAVATLGTPRIGPRRELKLALESFWSGTSDEKALIETAAGLRAANWARQKQLGVTVIPSNDFSFYDQVLDTSVMVGAIPEIYGWKGGAVSLATYFAMARGSEKRAHDDACAHGHGHGHGVPAQEMTKWFDTNYHYMVPELREGSDLRAGLAQADRRIPGSQGAGLPDPPGADRAGHVPKARQVQRRRLRPAVAAGPAAAGLRRGPA